MKAIDYVENKDTSEFYPTPDSLIEKMYNCINWNTATTVLEPSAGTGNIVKYLNRKRCRESPWGYRNENTLDIDCIEIDNNLRQILLYTFSEENADRLLDEHKELSDKYGSLDRRNGRMMYYNSKLREYVDLPENDRKLEADIRRQQAEIGDDNVHIIHDDFMTYTPFKEYDVIMMNPPFSCGDKHLLKALEIQKYGGQIVCLLNAETLRNPYTETRKQLVKLLDEYEADIEYIDNAFNTSGSERRTDVVTAMVYVNIPKNDDTESIFDKLSKAENYSEPTAEEITDLEVTDYIQSIINRYKVEIQSGIELIKTYKAMSPYLSDSFDDKYAYPIMKLTDREGKNSMTVNRYVSAVRLKYWRALFNNPKFVGKLTSALQDKYRKKISSFKNYDFSEFNIKTLLLEMNTQIKSGVEEETEKMFERLTSHSLAEGSQNVHYYNGWATNKAHKIGKKVIIPARGIFSEWSGNPRAYDAYGTLADIERVLNFFDGNLTAEVNMQETLEEYFKQGITKKIPLKYFEVTFYLKGTAHIVFNCPELLDRYNIYIGKRRRWLPPTFLDKEYKELSGKEKEVADSFAGKSVYEKLYQNRSYYLAGINQQTTNLITMSI